MNVCEWIVFERTSRWASALRMALARAAPTTPASLYEARTWKDLTSRLEARPTSVAVVEIRRDEETNALLILLAKNVQRFPAAHFAAVLDSGLGGNQEIASSLGREGRSDFVDALFEAGVAAIADSPRRLHDVLELGRRHAALGNAPPLPLEPVNHSVVAVAWASLPWQDRQSAVG